MPDPITDRRDLDAVMRLVEREAEAYLGAIDVAPVRPPGGDVSGDQGFPAEGVGSLRAVTELIAASQDGATRSAGPRFFHFVIGGVTPAALGADWLTSTLDQVGHRQLAHGRGRRRPDRQGRARAGGARLVSSKALAG